MRYAISEVLLYLLLRNDLYCTNYMSAICIQRSNYQVNKMRDSTLFRSIRHVVRRGSTISPSGTVASGLLWASIDTLAVNWSPILKESISCLIEITALPAPLMKRYYCRVKYVVLHSAYSRKWGLQRLDGLSAFHSTLFMVRFYRCVDIQIILTDWSNTCRVTQCSSVLSMCQR